MQTQLRLAAVCALTAAGVALLVGGTLVYAAEPAYTLTVLAQTGSVIGGKTLTDIGPPSIGNSGKVVFWGGFAGQAGIFTRSQLLVKTGDIIGGKTIQLATNFVMPGPVAINSHDTLAFPATFPGGEGVFTQKKAVVTSGETIDGRTLVGSFRNLAINDNGIVAFQANFNGLIIEGSGPFGVFTDSKFLVRLGDTVNGEFLMEFGGPTQLDNNGDAAVVFAIDDDFSVGTGIFLSPSKVVAKSSGLIAGTPVGQIGAAALSRNGRLAFQGGGRLFTRSRVIDTSLIDNESSVTVGLQSLSVNDAGTVAFVGLTTAGIGIFTQDHKVAAPPDLIGGKAISNVSDPAIDNLDEIAFRAFFADGTVAIVLAKPRGRAENVNPLGP